MAEGGGGGGAAPAGGGGGGGGAGGGGGRGTKVDELQPHPAKDQLPGVDYCITSPLPWPEAIMLGFQHYLVMLGTTVIIPSFFVPQMGGSNGRACIQAMATHVWELLAIVSLPSVMLLFMKFLYLLCFDESGSKFSWG